MLAAMEAGTLYYGDNLPILRDLIPDESVDLVYLDPPFNSNRSYSAIFADESGRKSDAQLAAFDDSWHWGPMAEGHYAYLTNSGMHGGRVPQAVSTIIAALRFGIGETPMLAYLVEMAVRLVELRRVLKPNGSLWLHCDPTASHYLRVLLDAIFGVENFINEVIWLRTTPKGLATNRLPRNHDVLLAFAKDERLATWNPQYLPHDPGRTAEKYSLRDPDGRAYQLTSLLNPNPDRPNLRYEFKGVLRTWRWTRDRMEAADAEGLIVVPKGGEGVPRFKRYLDEQEGIPLSSVWTDIPALNSQSKERLGWDTQKPLALLERVIAASSNPGDLILDPFCGCGTALVAAQTLSRRWIGIDITYLSIAVMRRRLEDSFGSAAVPVVGKPTEVAGARMLAQADLEGRYQFQWWALDEIGALPAGDTKKKGSDLGVDGRITFTSATGGLEQAIVSVKSGQPKADDVRVLKAVVEREKAAIGILVSLEEPTKPMRLEATVAGVFHSDVSDRDYPRIQLLSAADLLERGIRPQLPPLVSAPYQRAARVRAKADQAELFGGEADG